MDALTMALDGLPEHLKSRRTAEAVMAPAAIVAAGAGASVGDPRGASRCSRARRSAASRTASSSR